MEDIADEMIQEGCDPQELMDVTWMGEEELAERYLDNWYWIKDTADELWLDEWELLNEYCDDYDYE